jgi:hypothetical protein
MTTDAEAVLAQVNDAVTKAAVINSTYTFTPPVRSVFSPENLDPIVRILVPTTAPVRAALPRVQGFGQAAGWNMITSKLDNTSTGTNTAISFADAGQPLQTTQTFAFKTAAYKILGRDVELGRGAIASNRGGKLEDIRAKLEQVKTVEVLLGEENMILNGNSGSVATDFDGFSVQFTTNSAAGPSYQTASGIGVLANTLFGKGAEAPTHWIASSRQNQALADNLHGTGSIQRITMDQGSAVGGARVSKIVNPVTGNLIDIISSRYAGANGYLLTVRDMTGTNWIEVEDLESLSIYDVPTANHSVVSRVYEECVLKVVGEVYQAVSTGLSLV